MPARQAQPRNISPLVIGIGVLAGAAALVYGLPGLVLLWLALAVAGFSHPAPLPPKASERDLPQVKAAQLKHDFHRTMAITLIFPTQGWLPGWPPLYAFFGGLWAAVAGLHLPQGHVDSVAAAVNDLGNDTIWQWFSLANAVAALLIVWAVVWARRETIDETETCPGTRFSDAIKWAKKSPHSIYVPTAMGAVIGLVLAPIAYPYSPWPDAVVSLVGLLGGAMAGSYPAARRQALGKWRRVLQARRDWDERFRSMRKDPPPRLIDIEEHGDDDAPVVVHDLLCTSAKENAEGFFLKEDQMIAALGGGVDAAVAPMNRTDSQGQPLPGTMDMMRFSVIELPAPDRLPSIGDASVPEEIVEAQLRALFAWMTTALMQRTMMTDYTTITTGDSRVIAVDFTGDPTAVKAQAPETASRLGVEAVVDQRANNGAGQLYIGRFDDAEYSDESPVDAEAIEQFAEEDRWNERFSEMLRKDTAAPKPQWQVASSAQLADGTEVHQLPFVMRKGYTVEKDFFPYEAQLATAMDEASFVALAGWPGSKPGERFNKAFVVRWSEQPVPTDPKDLVPARSEAVGWVLAAMINQAFTDSKLPRPEPVTIKPLTIPRSPQHLWAVDLKLYGGITLAEVRKRSRQIQASTGADFLQIDTHPEGASIILGGDPQDDRTLLTTQARRRLDALKWEQVFADSGIKPESGVLPKLVDSQVVEGNDKIQVLTFSLRGTGLALESFVSRRPKLAANSGMGFVLPQPAESGKPDEIELVVSETDPIPFPAEPNYPAIDQAQGLPFAVDVYGRIVEYNPDRDVHLLLVGATGSGKSISLRFMMYGALIHGWEVYIADPSKGGVDFFFTKDYIAGMTGDVYEAAGMMRHVYAEVTRRKALAAEHGVSGVKELPEDIRPPRVMVFIDEFTSLMMQEKPPEKTDDPETSAEREEIVKLNAEKQTIGFLAGKIAREARSANVTLVLATQKLTAKILDSIPGSADLKANLSRAIQGNSTLGDKQAALRSPYDAPDLGESIPPGRGLWEPLTAPASMAIQAWYDPGEQDALRAELARRLDPWPEDDRPNWRAHVRDYDDTPTVQVIDESDEQAAETIEQDLGEIELDDLEFD